jgi:hypothetical protein
MTKRLFVYCEGQTEEMFVERLLRQHLSLFGIKVERPQLCATSLEPKGQRGGFVNWDAIEFDLKQIFAGDNDPELGFTTLLDVYRMPGKLLKLAGFDGPLGLSTEVDAVEEYIRNLFGESRFKPYLQRHELEALLLADMDSLESVFHRDRTNLQALRNDIAGFANAEDINHGSTTHPAARLERAITGYKSLKASNAYFVLAEAGLDKVRARCPRFDAWLSHWESWGMK